MSIHPLRYDTTPGPTISDTSGVPILPDGVPANTGSGFVEWGGEAAQFGTIADVRGQINVGQGIYNVKDPAYGAKGDGVTDERTSVTAALNAASAAGGGTIKFPKATYRMGDGTATGYLTINGSGYNHITIEGEPGTVWLVDSASQNYALLLQNTTGFTIRGIKYAYTTQPTVRTDAGPKCVRITGCTDVMLEDVEVSGSPQYGVGFEQCSGVTVRRGHYHDTMADGVNANSCTRVEYDSAESYSTGDDGLAIVAAATATEGQRGELSRIHGCVARSSNSRGIFAMGVGITVEGNTTDLTSGAGIGMMRDMTATDPGYQSYGVSISANVVRRAHTLASPNTDGPNGTARTLSGASSGAGAIMASEASSDPSGFNPTPAQFHKGLSIDGNSIIDAGWGGIFLHAVKGAAIGVNAIENPNTGANGTFNAAIWLRGCYNVTVGATQVYDDNHVGFNVYWEGSQGITVKGAAAQTVDSTGATSSVVFYDRPLSSGNHATTFEDVTVSRTAAAVLGVDGDLALTTAGKGLRVKEGTNAKMGTAVLAAGTVTVSTTAVTANSRIFLTCQTPGGTPGFLRVSAVVAGASFTITSSSGTDTSTVAWMLVEPA